MKLLLTTLSLLTIGTTTGNLSNKLNTNVINSNNNLKVTNGTNVPEDKYPWFSSITLVANPINQTGSGGILIAPNWVLTAAHVAADFHPEISPENNAKMVFGLYDTVNYDKSKLEIRTAKKIICWGGPHNVDLKNDIALIQLDKPITDIKPINLYSQSQKPIKGTTTTVMGYGLITKPDSTIDFPTHMQEVDIPVLSGDVVKDPRWTITDFDPKSNILAEVITGNKRINASKGDSRGPLIKKINGKYFAVGIVSHGPVNENYFTPEPAIYTFTGAFNDWIQNTIKN
ncbi:serine protease [Spiroplasma sp. AdecLV25b]|uniref:S1 family peptidase n=1 Tax=Spiroplasma sp. AdecLV25b TaxID=3027162 RepID=UPI0027DF9A2E|nr:serine protease [Spiroplasma sp. AdecLV25b]